MEYGWIVYRSMYRILKLRALVLLDVGNSRAQNDLDDGNQREFRLWEWIKVQTFPVVRFLVSNANSVVPLGPGPTSQIFVWMESPGLTGEVNLTP